MATTNKGIYYPDDYSQVADVPADLKKLAESVDEAIDDIPQYDDIEIKQDIQDLQKEQQTQNTAIEKNEEEIELLKSNLPDSVTTEEAEEITVQDAMNYYSSLDVSGNSTQATRSGKNKLYLVDVAETTNAHGITYSVKDGVITLNGTSVRAHYINFRDSVFSLPANTYTMSTKVVSGSYSKVSSGKQLNEVKEDGTETNIFNGNYIENTTTREITEDKSSVFFALYIGGTDVFNNYKFEVQLEEGTQATEIEKYGAMPSPDFPSEIKNCGDNINRFDKSTIKTGYYLDNTGTEVANTNYAISDYIEVEEDENYTYQGLNILTSYAAKGAYYNSSKEFISSLDLNATDTTILIPENAKYVKFTIRTTNNNQDTFKFEKGSVATPYTKYDCGSVDIKLENEEEEKTITFPLTEGQRLHAGDYLAGDGIHHVRKSISYNGTENWTKGSYPTGNSTQFSINKPNDIQNLGLCSHFTTNNEENGMALGTMINFYPSIETGLTTVELFKQWLAEQNTAGKTVTLEYECTEYTEAYTQEQQAVYNELQKLLLYKGYNYITCTDETKCKMKLTYRQDNNSKIKSLEERVAALENSEVTA